MLVEHFLRPESADRSDSDAGVSSYQVYPGRWVALALFCTLEMANALMWVSFAPISDISQHYFGSGWYGSITAINMLANIFLILYPFGTIAAVYTVKYFRPRNALIFAGVLTSLGALLRLLASAFKDDLGDGATYGLIFLGQAFGAIAQPYFTNFAPALSGIWFAVDERDISTSVGAMCSPLGNALGQLIPPFLVSESQDVNGSYSVDGMKNLMFVELVLTLIPLCFAFFFLRDEPPTPPSHSTKLKQSGGGIQRNLEQVMADSEEERNHGEWDYLQQNGKKPSFTHSQSAMTIRLSKYPDSPVKNDTTNGSNRSEVWEEVKELFRNKDFVLLAISFCVGVGFFNSIMTLLNQIVGPYGYSNDDAGTFGAVFIVCGLIGAGIMGKILETTKAYLTSLRVGIILAGLANVLCFSLLYRNNFTLLVIAFGILGACVLPLLPAMLENCAECTYPIPEEVSAGILYSGCNLSALGFIFALQYLLEEDRLGPPPFSPSTLFIFGILILAGVVIAFYNGEYKRHKNELAHLEQQQQHGESADENNGMLTTVAADSYDVHSKASKYYASSSAAPIQPISNNTTTTAQKNSSFFGGFRGFTSNSQKSTANNQAYAPPNVSVGEQHHSTDVNLVRVASTDGISTNQRYSVITGSSSMWTMSRDIQSSPSQSQGHNTLRGGGINNPIQQLVTAAQGHGNHDDADQGELHPSFRSNGSGL